MLALQVAGTRDDPDVVLGDVLDPRDEPGRVVVDVVSAGLTRTEPHWSTTWRKPDGAAREQPVVLGLEFAGRVRSLGPGVRGFEVGQRVLGMTESSRGGALAEAVSAAAHRTLPMPAGLAFDDASVLPLAGLTAWQALMRHGHIERGQRALIHGGAGGVGAFAVQIARWVGAHVTVTAAAKDEGLCRSLGADDFVDFERERFEDRGGGYDLVLDQIAGDVQERSWGVLKRGGRLIAIAGEEQGMPDQERARALGVTATSFIIESDPDALRRLMDLVVAGTVRPIIGKRFDLSAATQAFGSRAGRFAGKAVVVPPGSAGTHAA